MGYPHASPCKWVEWDNEGRPRCEHGWAWSAGPKWRCPHKGLIANQKSRLSPRWRERKREWNNSDAGRSSKALYELTRVRLYRELR